MRWLRKSGVAAVVVMLLGAAACTVAGSPPSGAGPCAVTTTANVAVPMRDGTTLRADVYRPATSQPVPVILVRTQYGKADAQIQPLRYQRPDWFALVRACSLACDMNARFCGTGQFSQGTGKTTPRTP